MAPNLNRVNQGCENNLYINGVQRTISLGTIYWKTLRLTHERVIFPGNSLHSKESAPLTELGESKKVYTFNEP